MNSISVRWEFIIYRMKCDAFLPPEFDQKLKCKFNKICQACQSHIAWKYFAHKETFILSPSRFISKLTSSCWQIRYLKCLA